jgi:endonuclease-3 related protein
MIGAVLVTGSTWKSVEKVLDIFRTKKLLCFKKIVKKTNDELAELIRPVGFHVKKAERLKAVSQLVLDRSGGDLDRYFSRDCDLVRRELLSISGIGPGTADNILLYAGQIPVYMVDPFTVRMLIRHGIADSKANELQIQQLIHQELTPDEEPYGAKLFQEMQEYVVRIGRDYCDKSKPDCKNCPLNIYLPASGAAGIAETPIPKNVAKTAAAKGGSLPVFRPPVESALKPVEESDLTEMERKIVSVIGKEAVPIDTVVSASGLPVHIVRATIAVLQMKKFVRQLEGNQVVRD